jgi:hypothetical protein
MFSPSLVSVLFHLVRSHAEADGRVVYFDIRSAADALPPGAPSLSVPIIGRSRDAGRLAALPTKPPEKYMRRDGLGDGGGEAAWGRVPLPELIEYFRTSCELPAKEEYVVLGTPMVADAAASGSLISQCRTLLGAHPLGTPKVVAAIVDSGSDAPGKTAENFNGRLGQVQPHGLEMSDHAVAVLWALIERLAHHKILHQTKLYCALVAPAAAVGQSCFTHGNSPEMLTALQALGSHLAANTLPLVINMSMGTHVGPHNGDSPLEDYIKTLPSTAKNRHVFVPSGNDGGSGVSATCALRAKRPDFLRARAQWPGSHETLIEFWWWDADGNLAIDVEARDPNGASLIVAGSLSIDSASATGVQLTQRTPASSSYPTFSSLFHANCHNGMSCIAFAMTNITGTDADFDFTLTSTTGDPVVNAWVAVAADRKAYFIGSNEATNMRVPSVLDELVCVAGVDAKHQPWARSSRGPSASYARTSSSTPEAPRMAHRVDVPSLPPGTSFACPRAAADAAHVLTTQSGLKPTDLVAKLLGSNHTSGWDASTGYGSNA